MSRKMLLPWFLSSRKSRIYAKEVWFLTAALPADKRKGSESSKKGGESGRDVMYTAGPTVFRVINIQRKKYEQSKEKGALKSAKKSFFCSHPFFFFSFFLL